MKKYSDLIINLLCLFLLNLSFSLIIFKTITLLSILYIILVSLFISSLIILITSTVKNTKVKKMINIILILPIIFIFIAQLVHYYFYSCFFGFYSLTKSGQIISFFNIILKIISIHIIPISIILIISIVFIVLIILTKKEVFKTKIKLEILLIIITPIIFTLVVCLDNNGINSSYNLMTNTNNTTLNVKQFSLPVGQLIDFKRYLIEMEPKLNTDKKLISYDKKLYNITDIDFTKKTDDLSIKTLNNYFESRTPTNKNSYTGIFKNKNLIFITGESFDFNAIDEQLTPNLYKMREEGIYFTNHYTPIYYASTSDGEYTNLTGNLPKEGIWSYIEAKDKHFPYSYANILKKQGYQTYSSIVDGL